MPTSTRGKNGSPSAPREPIVELTIPHAVPDIANLVTSVVTA